MRFVFWEKCQKLNLLLHDCVVNNRVHNGSYNSDRDKSKKRALYDFIITMKTSNRCKRIYIYHYVFRRPMCTHDIIRRQWHHWTIHGFEPVTRSYIIREYWGHHQGQRVYADGGGRIQVTASCHHNTSVTLYYLCTHQVACTGRTIINIAYYYVIILRFQRIFNSRMCVCGSQMRE